MGSRAWWVGVKMSKNKYFLCLNYEWREFEFNDLIVTHLQLIQIGYSSPLFIDKARQLSALSHEQLKALKAFVSVR